MRKRLSDEQGFTLIELLVVILIIGILAAIALPNFLGQRGRAQDASTKSNARNAVSQVEACYTTTQTYATCINADQLGKTGLEIGSGEDQVLIAANTADGYTITAKSKTGAQYIIAKDPTSGETKRTCKKGTKDGACPSDNATW